MPRKAHTSGSKRARQLEKAKRAKRRAAKSGPYKDRVESGVFTSDSGHPYAVGSIDGKIVYSTKEMRTVGYAGNRAQRFAVRAAFRMGTRGYY